MDPISYKTIATNRLTADKAWLLIDAEDQPLGRIASQIASLIRGKHKPHFTPHVACGDNVIVINADKIRLTGNKWEHKQYLSHTGYPGGQRTTTPRKLQAKFPTLIIERAVKGMLPKNRLGRQLFHQLFVYTGPDHNHAAQQPQKMTLKN
ncbi:MAG: 50S ribosomal protein L13 [Bacteroidota bacterium]